MKRILIFNFLCVVSLAAPCFAEAAIIYANKATTKAAIIYQGISDQPYTPTEQLIPLEEMANFIATSSNIKPTNRPD